MLLILVTVSAEAQIGGGPIGGGAVPTNTLRSPSAFTSGGGVSVNGTTRVAASLGGFAGGVTQPTQSNPADTLTIRNGYPGQLFVTETLTITNPVDGFSITENSLFGVNVSAINDDGTAVDARNGASFTTSSPAATQFISSSFRTNAVPTDTPVQINANFNGASANVMIIVVNTDDDNYQTSPYDISGDGLPDSWQIQYYPEGDPNSAPDAIAAGGQPNYFYWALSQNPLIGTALFRAESVQHEDERYLTFTYTRPTDTRAAVSYSFEYSTNLSQWDSSTPIVIRSIENEDETTTVTVRDNVPISSSPVRFLRMDVDFSTP
ncbi:hypothetical protein [Rubellicoccus peritrichatus]|uniref:Uncharacterized protein n=1 Tax=Rubellicoccus peritrichatus TaxID=3080537 RepID=A0AAQ3QQ67_9BACT|nr:hypothetical protein [Puniceicoccus sp. CR14]WOO39908.1 hypothetical protein RZN69_14880 [Puniceicoccus sp. CR14]